MVPDNEYACDNCNFGQNGAVCALHGVEVERRRSTSEMVSKLERTMNILTRFMYTMTGVALLGGMVLAGSYYYTASIERSLGGRQDVARGKIEVLGESVRANQLAIAVTEDRYLRIFQHLDAINRTLEKLANDQNTSHNLGPK